MPPDKPWLTWLIAAFTLLATLGSTIAFWDYLTALIEDKTGFAPAELPQGEALEYLLFAMLVLLIMVLIGVVAWLNRRARSVDQDSALSRSNPIQPPANPSAAQAPAPIAPAPDASAAAPGSPSDRGTADGAQAAAQPGSRADAGDRPGQHPR